jgi:PIN domain nuclease of toxin-antitoxin system
MDVRAWAARALTFPGLRLTALSPSIAIESTRLPGEIHRDPADRILIATARLSAASIVTSDERILKYAKQGHVRAVDARS